LAREAGDAVNITVSPRQIILLVSELDRITMGRGFTVVVMLLLTGPGHKASDAITVVLSPLFRE
jgi:hypothetical protein